MSSLIPHHLQLVGIAKTWAMKNLPGWSDESHRDLLARHGATESDGRVSAKTMGLQKLQAALDDYEARGWPRTRQVFKGKGQAKAKTVSPAIAHIVRLWGRLGQAGKVQNADRSAMLSWCARQVGRDVPNLDVLTAEELTKLTEALKGWAAR